jgi:hypothetical protein
MDNRTRRLEILKKVQAGELSLEEGSVLLSALEREAGVDIEAMPVETAGPEPTPAPVESETVRPEQVDVLVPPPARDEPEFQKPESLGCWKSAWSLVLWLGIGLTVLSAYWMLSGWQSAGFGWGFFLSWIPFLVGLLLIYLGYEIESSPWLYVRVRQKPGEKPEVITIVIPAPLRFAGWIMRIFQRYIPENVREKGVPEMLAEMEKSIQGDTPLHIFVDDDEDGEQVEVYIGK